MSVRQEKTEYVSLLPCVQGMRTEHIHKWTKHILHIFTTYFFPLNITYDILTDKTPVSFSEMSQLTETQRSDSVGMSLITISLSCGQLSEMNLKPLIVIYVEERRGG